MSSQIYPLAEWSDVPRVLFVGVENSGASQMCEALLNFYASERFEVQSAGLEPGTINPLVVKVMAEIDIDISQNKIRNVFDLWRTGALFQWVVTLCDEETAARCPRFPGTTGRLHWAFADPAKVTGSHEEKLQKLRAIREQMAAKIQEWLLSLPVEQSI